MATFVSQTSSNGPGQMLRICAAVNAALRGETANTGKFTLAAGATSITIQDKRCRAGRLALLMPLDAAAASLTGWLSNMTRDEMTFTFTSAPASDCAFGWAILGD